MDYSSVNTGIEVKVDPRSCCAVCMFVVSCWCSSTFRTKTYSCAITKLTWLAGSYSIHQPITRRRRIWSNGFVWVALLNVVIVDSPACRPGADRPLHFPDRAPLIIVWRFGCTTARCWSVVRTRRWGPASSTGRRSPLSPPPSHPRRRSDSDRASNRYVLGWNRESRSIPGNCDSWPGNAISRELTFLMFGMSALLQGRANSKKETPPVLNWRCQLTLVDLYNGRKSSVFCHVNFNMFCNADVVYYVGMIWARHSSASVVTLYSAGCGNASRLCQQASSHVSRHQSQWRLEPGVQGGAS